MSEHTKGKLRVSDEPNYVHVVKDGKADGLFCACDAGDYARSIEEGNANAVELVRRWNAHEELVEALEKLVKDKELLQKDEGIFACQCLAKAPDDITEPPPCDYCEAKAALAAAQSSKVEQEQT